MKKFFILVAAMWVGCSLCACGGTVESGVIEEQSAEYVIEQEAEETEYIEEVYTPTVEEVDEIVGVWKRTVTQYDIYFEFYPDGSGLYTTKSGDYYNATWSKNEYNGLYTIWVDHYEGVKDFTRTCEIKELPNVSRTEYYTCFSLEGEVYQKEE